jgi:hypothetical protein
MSKLSLKDVKKARAELVREGLVEQSGWNEHGHPTWRLTAAGQLRAEHDDVVEIMKKVDISSIEGIQAALAQLELKGLVERVGVRDGLPTFRAITPAAEEVTVLLLMYVLRVKIRSWERMPDGELTDPVRQELVAELSGLADALNRQKGGRTHE